jgi:hypothetical protein
MSAIVFLPLLLLPLLPLLFFTDVMGMFGFTACGFNLPFITKFILHMLLPICIISVMLVARVPAFFLKPKRRAAQKQRFLKQVLTILLIMYPGICTRIFQVLKCKTIGPGGGVAEVLQADFSITCGGGGAQDGRPLTIVYLFMGLYVVGLPLGILVALKCNRAHLYDKNSPKHEIVNDEYGTLYNQYEERFWWYEVVILVKKMLLTGAMCVIAAGSTAQVLIAILVVLFFMLLVFKTGPFVDDVDGQYALLVFLVCVSFFRWLFVVSRFVLFVLCTLFPNRLVVVFDIVANVVDFVGGFCHADGQQ